MLLDVDPVILDELLNDECKCEFRHRVTVCTIEITHIIIGCRNSTLVCEAAMKWQRQAMETGGKCNGCGRHLRDCWNIRPI